MAADQRVVAGAAEQHVVAGAAVELVLAGGAEDGVAQGVAGAIDIAVQQNQGLDIGAERVADAGDDRIVLPSPAFSVTWSSASTW